MCWSPRGLWHAIRTALPAGLDFAKAALTEPLACALHGIEACELERYGSDAEVAVFGAGPIGLLFVGVLAMRGYRVLLADPNPGAVGGRCGAWAPRSPCLSSVAAVSPRG